jgi:hypothetical protein
MVDFSQISQQQLNPTGFIKSALGGDYVRPWLFGIDIPFLTDDNHNNRTISALVRGIDFPGYSVNEATDASFNGMSLTYAGKPDFKKKDLKLKILSDYDMVLYKSFLKMTAAIVEPGRMVPNSPKSYKINNVSIYQLNKKGYPLIIFNFYGVWCQSVGTWSTSHSGGKPIEFDVVLKYDFYNINIDPIERVEKEDYYTDQKPPLSLKPPQAEISDYFKSK